MTHVHYEPGKYRLRINGHSGAARCGEDVVCASMTILGFTLLAAALERDEYNLLYDIDEKTASMEFICSPEEGAKDACRYLFDIIATGCEIVAGNEPDFVTFERSE